MSARILGAVLAGGQSRRFGGDKALALLNGRTLLDHVVAALEAQTDAVVICGRSIAGALCLEDRPRPGLGPLGGLAAALRFARHNGFERVLSAPCDTPRLPADLALRLAGDGAAIIDGQPLLGLWPAQIGPSLDAHLDSAGDRSVYGFADRIGARRIRLKEPVPNINRADDLSDLLASRDT